MRFILIAGIAALALTGCNKAEDAAPPAQVKRVPGAWKTSMEITKFSMPGAPKELETEARTMLGQLQDSETCLTPEVAASEDIAAKLAKPPGGAADCSFTRKVISGGDVDVVMSCKGPEGSEPAIITMKGTIQPQKADVQLSLAANQGGQAMNMEFRIINKWTGECKGTEPKL